MQHEYSNPSHFQLNSTRNAKEMLLNHWQVVFLLGRLSLGLETCFFQDRLINLK